MPHEISEDFFKTLVVDGWILPSPDNPAWEHKPSRSNVNEALFGAEADPLAGHPSHTISCRIAPTSARITIFQKVRRTAKGLPIGSYYADTACILKFSQSYGASDPNWLDTLTAIDLEKPAPDLSPMTAFLAYAAQVLENVMPSTEDPEYSSPYEKSRNNFRDPFNRQIASQLKQQGKKGRK